jgi:hypothetical protein
VSTVDRVRLYEGVSRVVSLVRVRSSNDHTCLGHVRFVDPPAREAGRNGRSLGGRGHVRGKGRSGGREIVRPVDRVLYRVF